MKRVMVLGTLLLAGAFSVVGVVGQQSQMIIEVESMTLTVGSRLAHYHITALIGWVRETRHARPGVGT